MTYAACIVIVHDGGVPGPAWRVTTRVTRSWPSTSVCDRLPAHEDECDVVSPETEGGTGSRLKVGKASPLRTDDVQSELDQLRVHAGGLQRRR